VSPLPEVRLYIVILSITQSFMSLCKFKHFAQQKQG
jgi:hypothetical protein